MKRLVLLMLLTGSAVSYAQQAEEIVTKTLKYTPEEYGKLKEAGQLPTDVIPVVVLDKPVDEKESSRIPLQHATLRGGSSNPCVCYQDPDATYTLAMPPNDDGSTGSIAIPFTFCFYGTNYNSLFINNNGNVSFGTAYSTFSATGFPSNQFVMIAPFWGDVDTRNGLGTVKYKIYPNAIYINWEDVGYYNIHGDKRNTFQLILSDGTDSIAGIGNNVAFCYQEMEWTTGDASQGVGGFGGVPATVGANKGDGINYIQFGRFDQPLGAYDGPFLTTDGIDWLDYQSLKFDVCVTNNNVAPVFSDFQPGGLSTGGGGCGDTIRICDIGDTLMFTALAVDPNAGDIVTLTASAPGVPGFSTLLSIPGNPAAIYMQLITSNLNIGLNYVYVTATDNGSPAASSMFSFWIFVDTTGVGNFTPTIFGDSVICTGETTNLYTQNTYDAYYWNTTSVTDDSGPITAGGQYFCTIQENGCWKSIFKDVIENPIPVPAIYGPTSFCTGNFTNLTTDSFYTAYSWVNNGSQVSTTNAATVTPTTVTLTVTDTNGCVGSTTSPIVNGISVNISGNPNGCTGQAPVQLVAYSPNGVGTYVWSNGTNNDTTIALATGYLSVTYTDTTGCYATDSVLVTLNTTPTPTITGDLNLCQGETTILNAGSGYTTYAWSNGNNTQMTNPIGTAGTYSVTVTQNGCSGSDTVTVVVNALAAPFITGNTNICNGNTTTLSTGNFVSYNWTLNGNNVSSGMTASVGPGNVTVTVTDGNGCTGSASTVVTSDAPFVGITGISATCPGVPVVLTAMSPDGPGTYTWSHGDNDSVTTVTTSGNYIVTFVDAGGCSNTDTFTVTIYPGPNAAFSASPDTAYNTSTLTQFTNSSTVGAPATIVSWMWVMSDTTMYNTQNPSHTFDHYGQYTVTLYVTTNNGCVDSVSQEYWVIPPITFPNVFSPGGSPGSNDMLVFPNLYFFGPAQLSVYDRWGLLMYESNDYRNNWDGTSKGKMVPDGTYFYILKLKNGKVYKVPLTIFVK